MHISERNVGVGILYSFMNPSQTWAPARQPILALPSSRLADPGMWMDAKNACNARKRENERTRFADDG